MEDRQQLRIDVVGLELEPLEEGPGDGIRLVVSSGYTGESVVTLLLSYSKEALSRAIEFIRIREKGKSSAELEIVHKKTKVKIKGYSQEDAALLFEQVRGLIAAVDKSDDRS